MGFYLKYSEVLTQMIFFKTIVFLIHSAILRVYCKYTTADYLDSLDYVISRHINEPTAEASDKLFDDIDKYYDTVKNLLESLRAKEQSVQEAIVNYWALGKPGFTQDYDVEVYKKMQNFLRFTDREMGVFFDKIEEVKALWEEFKEECEKDMAFCAPVPVLIS